MRKICTILLSAMLLSIMPAKLLAQATISLTPYPAKDFLNIHFGNTTGNAAISIYDEGGKKVYNTQMAVNKGLMAGINISKLTPGNYFISVNINGEMNKEQFIKVKN